MAILIKSSLVPGVRGYFGLGNVGLVHEANCSAEGDFRWLTGGIAKARETRFASTPGYTLSPLTGLSERVGYARIEIMNTLSKQCRTKAEVEGYVSLMNDTKWKEICFAFRSFKEKPIWRTLDFLNGYLSSWDTDWFHHVGPDFCSIEWLEIDPRDCSRENIRSTLNQIGVPFEETEQTFKVIGYRQ